MNHVAHLIDIPQHNVCSPAHPVNIFLCRFLTKTMSSLTDNGDPEAAAQPDAEESEGAISAAQLADAAKRWSVHSVPASSQQAATQAAPAPTFPSRAVQVYRLQECCDAVRVVSASALTAPVRGTIAVQRLVECKQERICVSGRLALESRQAQVLASSFSTPALLRSQCWHQNALTQYHQHALTTPACRA